MQAILVHATNNFGRVRTRMCFANAACTHAFLIYIITRDEMRMHYWAPEFEEKSKIWKTLVEPMLHKFKQQPSARKVMVTVFFDQAFCITKLLFVLHLLLI